ncbi:MAG: hypothetical protein A2534_03530 [Candidatus Magasanikbacteria bacterium RIFOXYD2_FULL_39_9]|uniref:SIMPL domain-containing protein n=1 Tax=Candidatus Magasanikbacteria bacterium RIFOXYD1_FULL_40_23 TaxID=1798705 RepID=A0A1F6P829_9BACT|nr:MAG: hypothetical protein A2563_05065 [Candidatus Magasanikbacteria bacterium RIFOXYD1_FULL_40_23]OGH92996.1 MAG: hypothetical protein A2534_03530 [Candidatus Magasanikbacteria bacterium RIFOXYD2_FULL_39_9]
MALPTGGSKLEQMIKGNVGAEHAGHHFGKKLTMTLVGILLAYLVVYVGTLIHKNMKEYQFIGRADRMERTVAINGFGKVSGKNDIAVTTIGFSNTDKDVSKAQADNKKVMDQIYMDLKAMGIEEKDLQGNYNIYPDYNYTQDKGQELKGYRVSNSLTIKIRDLSKVSGVLSLAGKHGATEVNGLSFTVDEPENLKAQAREKALSDAQAKAASLAQKLGVRLGSIINYNEYEGPDYSYQAKNLDYAMGMGGAGSAPAAVPGGSMDMSMNVNIIYEILQ